MKLRGRFLVVGTAGVLGLAGVLVAALPASAQPEPRGGVQLSADAPPALPRGAASLGIMGAGSPVRLDVTLKVPDPAALTAFIAAVSDPHSPEFGQFLRPGQFGTRFGPSLSTVAAVRTALEQAGLSPGQVTSNRLSIPVTVTAATVKRVFGTGLVRYRLADGRVAFANSATPSIPAAAAPYVSGIVGLNNLDVQHSMLVRPKTGLPGPPRASAGVARDQVASTVEGSLAAGSAAAGPKAACSGATAQPGFTADQLASYYGMSSLYAMGDGGKGVTIGLLEFEPYTGADITAYKKCYGLSTTVAEENVDGGVTPRTLQSGEAALDIEDAAGLAPASSIKVYEGPNTDQGAYDTYAAMINGDVAQVISTSWGECESQAAASADVKVPGQAQQETDLAAEGLLFEQAAAQGQTVFAAAGDDGSTACEITEGGNLEPEPFLAVSDPGSQPDVLSVGGTTIGATSQSVWNDIYGAGGGGISQFQCMPGYQDQATIPGLINSFSKADTAAGCASGRFRQVPDVSADADPNTGYAVYFDGGWATFGGTSAAAPLWAAVAALTDASPFCASYGSRQAALPTSAGVPFTSVYDVAAADHATIYSSSPQILTDVKAGNNFDRQSGYTGTQVYPATAGYDQASGLGTPLVNGRSGGKASNYYPGLAASMCRHYATRNTATKVTGVTPKYGPLKGERVTVTGSGFLPIAGADVALVAGARLTASCTSTTRCTVTMPGRRISTTVNIRISAEDSAFSRVTGADTFRYVVKPTTRSISPNHGPARGGTRVTIRGANFYRVTAVHFGSRKGTSIKVVSSTEIIVTAPTGSGTVKVTVTAAGGTSTGSIRFRY
jgi:hypothetical protein